MGRPVILLLHAFPLDARMWERQATALGEAGYEVVAPDVPGPEPMVGLGSWAERVLSLVEGDFVPVGLSMGGYLAFELWRRDRRRIPALVLADTRAAPDSPDGKESRNDAIRVLGEDGFEPFWEALAPKLFGADDPGARAIAAEQPLTGLVSALETLRDRPDSRALLPSIDVPVLVIVGEKDGLTPPRDAEAMAEALPRARLATIPGAGHLSALERPDEFGTALLAFLREVAP
jgi:3-oxoadipate enol-lactonase